MASRRRKVLNFLLAKDTIFCFSTWWVRETRQIPRSPHKYSVRCDLWSCDCTKFTCPHPHDMNFECPLRLPISVLEAKPFLAHKGTMSSLLSSVYTTATNTVCNSV